MSILLLLLLLLLITDSRSISILLNADSSSTRIEPEFGNLYLHCVSIKKTIGYHPTTNDNFHSSCPIPVIFLLMFFLGQKWFAESKVWTQQFAYRKLIWTIRS